MKKQIQEIKSISLRCEKCNRKYDLISECDYVSSQTINKICCRSCVKILQKQHKLNVEQTSDILSECQQIKAFLTQNKIIELSSNSIFFNTLDITDPQKELLKISTEFQNNININEAIFKMYCKNRVLYKQLFENHSLKQQIENASDNLKSIIKQYFYDEEGTPVFSMEISKRKQIVAYSNILSHYLLILKYYTITEFLVNQNKKIDEKYIMQEEYNPTIYISIYDLNNKENIYEDVLIQGQNLFHLPYSYINSFILEKNQIIYVVVNYDIYQIKLNSKQHLKQTNYKRLQVLGQKLISDGEKALQILDPTTYEIIQRKEIYEIDWRSNRSIIDYDKKINSFIKHDSPLGNYNKNFEIIQLDNLKCIKKIIIANQDRYDQDKFYKHDQFKYICTTKILVFVRESQLRTSQLILLNIQTNKILRKVPLSFNQGVNDCYLLKKQTVICLNYHNDELVLYQISTGRKLIQFEKFQIYQIIQDQQLAIAINEEDLRVLELAH
ncbi:unnamed protein product [Paramecium octaurelia]|uniref:Uncharacterized protein n=1 Tax=Paramecium octaurelia TaxID=43137 RepID=A0A8S1TPZ6_PAROT|nr:unnamed protein product [Paramecium octaurelia]